MKSSHGYALIVLVSAIWGTLGIFGKFAFHYGIDPVTLIAFRVVISSTTVLVFATVFKKRLLSVGRHDLPKLLVLGLFGVALQRITYFYAIDLTTVTIAAVLFYTYPFFVAIYSVFAKEKITFPTIFAIVLAFTGVAFVVKAYESSWLSANLLGVTFGFICGVLFAVYFISTKKLRERYANWTLLLYGEGIAALALAPELLFSIPKIINYPMQLWLLILIIAFFPSLSAYLIFSYALKHVEYSKGSILSVVEPSTAAILSATIFGENFEPLQMVGLILILIGIILLFYRRLR
jgi:drug/metabolite transporter (DMT)-like permease